MIARVESERQFQGAVLDLARRLGWKVAHFHDSRRQVRRSDGSYRTIGDGDAKGFPDLVLIRPPRLLIVELKTDKGRVRPEQHAWLHSLGLVQIASGGVVEACVWRPRDWEGIVDNLTRIGPLVGVV